MKDEEYFENEEVMGSKGSESLLVDQSNCYRILHLLTRLPLVSSRSCGPVKCRLHQDEEENENMENSNNDGQDENITTPQAPGGGSGPTVDVKYEGHQSQSHQVEYETNEHKDESHQLQTQAPRLGDVEETLGDILLGDVAAEYHGHYTIIYLRFCNRIRTF